MTDPTNDGPRGPRDELRDDDAPPALPRHWLRDAQPPEASPAWDASALRIVAMAEPSLRGTAAEPLPRGIGAAIEPSLRGIGTAAEPSLRDIGGRTAAGSDPRDIGRRTAAVADEGSGSWWNELDRWWTPAAALAAAAAGLLFLTGAPALDRQAPRDSMPLAIIAAGGDVTVVWDALGIPADPVLALIALDAQVAMPENSRGTGGEEEDR